jgi:hypothetical protein
MLLSNAGGARSLMNVEAPNNVQGFALRDDSDVDWHFDYTNKLVVLGVAVLAPS